LEGFALRLSERRSKRGEQKLFFSSLKLGGYRRPSVTNRGRGGIKSPKNFLERPGKNFANRIQFPGTGRKGKGEKVLYACT